MDKANFGHSDNLAHLAVENEGWTGSDTILIPNCRYLDLKYALPKETRIAFAKVFWELTMAPGMDATMVEVWSHYCRRLLK